MGRYLVWHVLLPVLRLLLTRSNPGPAAPALLEQFLALLGEALPAPADRHVVAPALLGALGLAARRATVAGAEKPMLARIAAAVLRPAVPGAWGPHPSNGRAAWVGKVWLALPAEQLNFGIEGILTRKAHHDADLEVLLPAAWHPGCAAVAEESDPERRRKARARAEQEAAEVGAAVLRTEEAQGEFAALLALAPGAPLVGFAEALLRRNAGAKRDRPPPTLSDPRTVAQCFFTLLRVLWPYLEDTSGPLYRGVPTAHIVRGAHKKAPLSSLLHAYTSIGMPAPRVVHC